MGAFAGSSPTSRSPPSCRRRQTVRTQALGKPSLSHRSDETSNRFGMTAHTVRAITMLGGEDGRMRVVAPCSALGPDCPSSVSRRGVPTGYPNASRQRVTVSCTGVVRARLVLWCNHEWSLRFSFFKTHLVCFAAWPGDTSASGSCRSISGGTGRITRMGDTSHIEAGKRTRRRFGVPLGPDCRRLAQARAKPPGRVAGRHAVAASGHADRAITVQRPHSHLAGPRSQQAARRRG